LPLVLIEGKERQQYEGLRGKAPHEAFQHGRLLRVEPEGRKIYVTDPITQYRPASFYFHRDVHGPAWVLSFRLMRALQDSPRRKRFRIRTKSARMEKPMMRAFF
jgi:hypothetical protein